MNGLISSLQLSQALYFLDALKINPNVLSYGKLRMAWAQAAVPPDPYQVNFTYATSPFAGQLGTLLPSTLPARALQATDQYYQDIGLTLGFLKNRLNFDFGIIMVVPKIRYLVRPLPDIFRR